MSGPAGSEVCSNFVEALGLKTLFSALMGKVHSGLVVPTHRLQTVIGFKKAESDSTSFGGHFPYSGNNIVSAFESTFRLNGPNTSVD